MTNSAQGPASAVPTDPTESVVILEEYRQVYALAIYRLTAMDTRIPIAGTLGMTILAAIVTLPSEMQALLLLAVPLSVAWFFRTTVQHAISFEDAIRYIACIEHHINKSHRRPLLGFQTNHPSRSRYVGGRTGAGAVGAAFTGGLLVLGACLFLSGTLELPEWIHTAYTALLIVAAFDMLMNAARYWRYRYFANNVNGDDRGR